MEEEIEKPRDLGIFDHVLRTGAHWSGTDPPDWLCLFVQGGHAGFFPEMEKRMAHYQGAN